MVPMRSRHGMMEVTSLSPPPHHLVCLLLIVMVFLMFSWYMAYDSVMESIMDQLSIAVMVCPLLLLLAVHWLSVGEKPTFPLPRSEPNSIHRAGSSPWGVGFLLVFLMVMISYQSTFQDQWFPIWRRS